jgi:hypothetical protein
LKKREASSTQTPAEASRATWLAPRMASLPKILMLRGETRLYFWDRFWGFMSYLTENASLIRMQEINVTYNLPKSFTNWLGLNYVKVFAQANNPFSIYFNKWGEDPEFPRGNVPLQSAYLLGVKCNF